MMKTLQNSRKKKHGVFKVVECRCKQLQAVTHKSDRCAVLQEQIQSNAIHQHIKAYAGNRPAHLSICLCFRLFKHAVRSVTF